MFIKAQQTVAGTPQKMRGEALRAVPLAGDTMSSPLSLPLVSIGFPVYNGARYLREALDSLIGQDYPNVELIISDNASTDETEAICREYAVSDERIRYYREELNRGAVWNFNRVFELSNGKYFMWSAFDDVRHPQYVSRCVEALQSNPTAVLCCTNVRFIDETGRELRENVSLNNVKPVGRTPRERIEKLASVVCWYDIYGLIRRSVLTQTALVQPRWGGDVTLMMSLCLRGDIIALPESLFYYRIFVNKTEATMAASLASTAEVSAGPKVSYSLLALDLIRAILSSPVFLPSRPLLVLCFARVFLVRNGIIRRYVYEDVGRQMRLAWGERRFRDYLGLRVIAAFVWWSEGFKEWREGAVQGVSRWYDRLYGRVYWKMHSMSRSLVQHLPHPRHHA